MNNNENVETRHGFILPLAYVSWHFKHKKVNIYDLHMKCKHLMKTQHHKRT